MTLTTCRILRFSTLVAVAAMAIACGPSSAETLADVQRGAGGLPAEEVEALTKLAEAAGVEPAKMAVLKGQGGSLAKAPNGFLIDGGHVTAIKLSGTKLASTAPMAALKHLKGVSLTKNRLSSLEGLGSAGSIISLDVSHNRLESFEGLEGSKALRGLRASHNQLKTTRGLKGAGSLRTLVLDHNQISDLADLADLAGLESLDLGANRLTNLEGLSGLKRVKIVRLTENALTTTKGLGGLPSLEELYLDRNEIAAMPDFPALGALVHLDLSHNELTSVASNAASTKGIVLEGNPLTEAARAAVKAAGPQCATKTGFNRGLIAEQSLPIPCSGPTCEKAFVEISDRIQLDLNRSMHEKRAFDVRISTDFGPARLVLAHPTLGHIGVQAYPGRPCTAWGRAIIGEPLKLRRPRRSRRRRQGAPPKQAFILIETNNRRAKNVVVRIAPLHSIHDGQEGEPDPAADVDAGVPEADGGPAAEADGGSAGDAAPAVEGDADAR